MKNFILILFMLSIFSGCASPRQEVLENPKTDIIPAADYPPSDLSECKNEDEAAQIMVKSILDGLSSSNYNEFTRDFASKDKTPFNLKAFQEACTAVDNNLGILLSLQYLGSVNKIGYTVAIWKAKYSKAPEDIILEMYIVRENDEYKVSAFIPK